MTGVSENLEKSEVPEDSATPEESAQARPEQVKVGASCFGAAAALRAKITSSHQGVLGSAEVLLVWDLSLYWGVRGGRKKLKLYFTNTQ